MLSVQSDVFDAMKKLRSITEAQQLRFAVAKALTQTAAQVQKEVRTNMRERFTIRRPWVIQGIRTERATKANLTAVVYSRDRFMGLQEEGGIKTPRGNFVAIPTRAVRRTKTQMISKADRPAALGDRAHVIEFNGDTWLALKKPRKGRGGNELRLMYLLVPRADIEPRLGLRSDGLKIARSQFVVNLRDALRQALASAR